MQIEVIETFLKVAELSSFNRASQLLFVSQPTVTARIQTLEASLGQRLFLRGNPKVELTQAGRVFLPYAQVVARNWRKARQEIALPKGFEGILTVGAPPSLWYDFLIGRMSSFQTATGTVAINAITADATVLTERLDAGEIDVAVMHEPAVKTDWASKRLFEDELILVSTTPRELVRWDPKYVYIDWGSGYREQHYRAYPVDDTPIVSFSDAKIAFDYILAVGGSAYLPTRWLNLPECHGRLHAVPQAPVFTRDVFMVYDANLLGSNWRLAAIEALICGSPDNQQVDC
jgi:DNA-binding transcriptional LysR family regulator